MTYYNYPTNYYPVTTTTTTTEMSSAAFHHRVTELVSNLLQCREHCDDIAVNRRISHEHGNLDNLRAALKTSANSVWFEFHALRNVMGSRMDLGDEAARHTLSHNIRDLEGSVGSRLRDIALRRLDGPARFKDMLKKVERIEERVKTAMIDLAERLGGYAVRAPPLAIAPAPAPAAAPVLQRPRRRATTTTKTKKVAFKEVDTLRHHLKDSWDETLVGNMVLYVNCHDRTKMTWVKPNGYIKPLPKPAVVPVWGPSVATTALARRDPWVQYRI